MKRSVARPRQAVHKRKILQAVPPAAEPEGDFEKLKANRVEILCADRNERSWRVAERAGFPLEGILRNNCIENGELRDTRIYAKVPPR